MKYLLFHTCTYLLTHIQAILSDVTCKDEAGKPVDWFITYKLPKINHKSPVIKNGTGYFYLGEHDLTWNLSERNITENTTWIGQTLNPLYNDPKSKVDFFIMYNDEDPNGPVSLIRGHTKGVVVLKDSVGFWLVHSVPKYPPHTDKSYEYPKTGHEYGQSFLCVTLNISQVDKLSSLLFYNDPCVYDFYLPEKFAKQFPLLDSVTKKKHVQQSPWNETLELTSLNNVPFYAFAKYKDFDRDLYSPWVARYLTSNLYVESWQNGPGKLHSNCTNEFTVMNVKEITFQSHNISFKSTRDHSKIAISNGQLPWTCIGDINRMKSQTRRGGGTVCVQSQLIWKNFHQLVTQVESCDETLKGHSTPETIWV